MATPNSLLKQITPPFVFSILRNIRNAADRKNNSRNNQSSNLSWHTIRDGPLAGRKIFGDIGASWFADMVNGTYDQTFFDELTSLQLTGKTILEIGAHVGYHAMAFAEKVGPKGSVFAFEPNPYNTERFKKNLQENKDLENRIRLLEIALSDSNGTEEFVFGSRVDKGSSSGSFLDRADTAWEKSVYEKENIGFKRMRVETKTLDELRSSGKIPNQISLCKIDVEGAEHLVLSGAQNVMRTDKPIILVEVHSIFNMWKIVEIFNTEKYHMKLLEKEPDGRCFFVALPTEPTNLKK